MKSIVCFAVLLLLAGSAAAQRRGAASPSPAPTRTTTPAAAAPGSKATNATATTSDTMEPEMTSTADNDTATDSAVEGIKRSNDTRIKAFYDSPKAAAERIPELRELNKLVAASPAVEKELKDKDLVATIFAPNNEAVKGALEYLNTNFPNMTTKELAEMGIVDSLLTYHVTAGNAALTSDRLRNGMKLTMMDGNPITIIKKAAEAGTGARRRLLQAEDASFFVKTNSNQSVAITDANYQGGKAIIHIVDGVLIPASLAGNYSLTDIPGASNATAEETTELDAAGANATEPSANATSAAGGAAAPAPAPTPAPKSSAGAAVATLLAAPALLAVLML